MSSSNSKREQFGAFVCDDETLEALRPVIEELGWNSDHIDNGGMVNAVKTLTDGPSPHILFVDLSDCGSEPLNDIHALAEVCEPGTVVIAVGKVNDVRLFREFMASGIQDYLLKPFTADQLRDALTHAQEVLSGSAPSEPVKERNHIMTSVIGVRGGVGTSTVATSVAYLLGEKSHRTTALIDLDLHFGTGAMAFDLEPGRGLTDAIENPDRIDGLFIERAMVRANEKLSILSSEAPINQPVASDGEAINLLLNEMHGAFECTLVDTPRFMLGDYPHLAQNSGVTILVTELTLAGARDTIRMLAWLKTNAPSSRVIVVANKVPLTGGLEVGRKDFEKSIERKIDFVIPEDGKAVAQGAKVGKPLGEVASGKTLQPLMQLASAVITAPEEGEEGEGEGAPEAPKSRMGGLKSIFKPKPKPPK